MGCVRVGDPLNNGFIYPVKMKNLLNQRYESCILTGMQYYCPKECSVNIVTRKSILFRVRDVKIH